MVMMVVVVVVCVRGAGAGGGVRTVETLESPGSATAIICPR